MNLEDMVRKHYKQCKDSYRYRKGVGWYDPKLEQDSSNCWIFSSCQNTARNWLGFLADVDKTKSLLSSFGLNTQVWGKALIACAGACEIYKDKHIFVWSLDVLKNTRLFANMLKEWYWFIYSRSHYIDLAVDVRDNWNLDSVIENWPKRHSTSIWFDKATKKLIENGNRKVWSLMDDFPRWSTENFIASVRKWGVDSTVLFIDIDPNFR